MTIINPQKELDQAGDRIGDIPLSLNSCAILTELQVLSEKGTKSHLVKNCNTDTDPSTH